MINREQLFKVKNRSSSTVVYRIPETNLRREFQPGEIKRVPFSELEKLTYQQGGRELLEHFLQLIDEEATDNLGVHREPEYNMSEAQVEELLIRGSLDQFLDALDFAPIGVIDLIKTKSVSLPLVDLNKRKALKDKTGFDVDKALIHIEEEKADAATPVSAASSARRTNVNYQPEETLTEAEEAPVVEEKPKSKYKVVSKES